jgi:hypothetical protein
VPLSYNTLTEFRQRNGYDLASELPSLYADVGDWRKVRFDYFQTLHDLWKESYFEPIYAWCTRNNIGFTGHWMEHEWPSPWTSPSDASLYAYAHMPGIDMLTGLQAFGVRSEGRDPFYLFTIRQMTSVAEQLGRRAFSESFGVSGTSSAWATGSWFTASTSSILANPGALFGARANATTRPPSPTPPAGGLTIAIMPTT